MKPIHILFLLFANFCFAQDTISIAKQDTVYIVLPQTEKHTTKLFKDFKFVTGGNGKINEELFFMKDNRRIAIITDRSDKNNKLVKRKDFLKKNKERIIDMNFIETYSPKKIFVDIFRLRHLRTVVFIIDKRQLKKRKIILKKAFVYTEDYNEM